VSTDRRLTNLERATGLLLQRRREEGHRRANAIFEAMPRAERELVNAAAEAMGRGEPLTPAEQAAFSRYVEAASEALEDAFYGMSDAQVEAIAEGAA